MDKTSNRGIRILCDKNDKLNSIVLLSNDDIEGYDWKKHEIILSDKGANNLKRINIMHERFSIYLNDRKLYDGKFENAVNSGIGINCPAILTTPGETHSIVVADNNRVKIWYFGKKPDPRENNKLKDYLMKENLLK